MLTTRTSVYLGFPSCSSTPASSDCWLFLTLFPECRSNTHVSVHLVVGFIVDYASNGPLASCRSPRVVKTTDPRRFSDRFGRKKSLYLAWVWLVIVSDH